MTKLFHASLLALVLLLVHRTALCAAEAPKVDWRFEVSRDSQDIPSSSVWLVVNGRSVRIASKVIAVFHALERKDYSAHDVPTKALSACSGWWAGGGDEYYVLWEAERLALFHRELNETKDIPHYKRVRNISVPKLKH